MKIKGQIIIFEGPDGVGKTTVSLKLKEDLEQADIQCRYLSFPGKEKGSLGELVYRIHHENTSLGINELAPESLQTLHIAAHIDNIKNVLIPAIHRGETIILDRYWWSAYVYGLEAGIEGKFIKKLINIEKYVFGKIKPSIIFLLKRPSLENNTKYARLMGGYERLADKEGKKHKVQEVINDSNVQTIVAKVSKIIQDSLSKKKGKKGSECGIESRKGSRRQKELFQNTQIESSKKINVSPFFYSAISPAKPTIVYLTYWKFAAERQEVFFRRMRGERTLTNDPIIGTYKFTNTYRASDRVSQYLIKNVIYSGDQSPEEVFFRTLLFKVFNKIETWEMLVRKFGNITFKEYSFQQYNGALKTSMAQGIRIYSPAYIMASGKSAFGYSNKHSNHLKLIEAMMKDSVPARICEMKKMHQVYDLLLSYPALGKFLAFQYTIDLNYSNITDFSEMEFVVPGPGAMDGIKKCFSSLGGLNEADIIKLMAENQEESFKTLGIKFKTLWGRPLQLIDCQNIFCEVDKYSRIAHPDIAGVSGRTRIKQKYKANTAEIDYWYPPKWRINENIHSNKAIAI